MSDENSTVTQFPTGESKSEKKSGATGKKAASKAKTAAKPKKSAKKSSKATAKSTKSATQSNGAATNDNVVKTAAASKAAATDAKPAAPKDAAIKKEAKKTDAPQADHDLSGEFMEVLQSSKNIIERMLRQPTEHLSPSSGMADPMNISSVFADVMMHLASSPHQMMQAQLKLWQQYLQLWQNMVMRTVGQEVAPVVSPESSDRRFKHEDWSSNDVFDFIKQSYLINSRWLLDTVQGIEGLDEHTRNKAVFHTKQLIDAFSPTNFPLTNPEVLHTSIESRGENLVRGLNNLLKDLDRGGGTLKISQTDMDHFELGKNIALSPGKVVFQNDVFQLIQYAPETEKVYEKPMVIFPAWINKFYILDLQPKNSFIRWLVEQGHTVFLTSWVNPDASLADVPLEYYMHNGILAAVEAAMKITGADSVNTIGYCVAGTMLGSTLAYMAAHDDNRINSATFLTSQLDFKEAGEMLVFVDEEQLNALEKRMEPVGYLDGADMSQTFNMLRANDLIWSYVVNNYMLGREPFPFDLLYWNADSTRMPKRLHMFYLREYFQHNKLSRGELVLDGTRLDLGKVKIPIFMQASKEDHIAPARSVFNSHKLFGGDDVTYMVAGSGHIAGVVNPPAANKYMYWTNTEAGEAKTYDQWWDNAVEHPGSWWPHWEVDWLRPKSGKLVDARVPGDGPFAAIEDAPGSYVKVKS